MIKNWFSAFENLIQNSELPNVITSTVKRLLKILSIKKTLEYAHQILSSQKGLRVAGIWKDKGGFLALGK